MKPSRFVYLAPSSVDEALAQLAEHGSEANVLAGGQSLVPLMNMRKLRPAVLLDVNGIDDLGGVEANGELRLGGLVRHLELERSPLVGSRAPLLVHAVRLVANPAIRSRGTLAGSLAHADPAAELPAAVLALEARMVVRSARGERVVDARDFFRGPFTTALEPDELLVEVRVPPCPGDAGSAFEEISRRFAHLPMAAAAAVVSLEDGLVREVRLALAGIAETPVRAELAEQALVGHEPTPEAFRAAAEHAVADLQPRTDMHASGDYRRHVAGVLVQRALARAAERR